jgi:hypothetical protein
MNGYQQEKKKKKMELKMGTACRRKGVFGKTGIHTEVSLLDGADAEI